MHVLLLYCFTGRSGSDHDCFVDAVMIRARPSSEAVQKKYIHRDNHYSQTDDTTQTDQQSSHDQSQTVVIVSVYVLLLYCFTRRSGSDHDCFVDQSVLCHLSGCSDCLCVCTSSVLLH
jgi:hypothetical protein